MSFSQYTSIDAMRRALVHNGHKYLCEKCKMGIPWPVICGDEVHQWCTKCMEYYNNIERFQHNIPFFVLYELCLKYPHRNPGCHIHNIPREIVQHIAHMNGGPIAYISDLLIDCQLFLSARKLSRLSNIV